MEQVQWADRGQLLQLDTPDGAVQGGCIGVSRLGSVQVAGGFSIWVQLHGSSWVEAKEGKFRLRSGDWIAFEKDSKPDRAGRPLRRLPGPDADRATRCAKWPASPTAACMPVAANASRHDARIALRLWREAAARMADAPNVGFDTAALRPILLHLAGIQRDLAARIPRCPGRSRSRKRQVFGRLQRARLYLEGNCDRVVRISELAELTSFSSWYFSKTFHVSVRGESAGGLGAHAPGARGGPAHQHLDDDRRSRRGQRLRQLLQLRSGLPCALRPVRHALSQRRGIAQRGGEGAGSPHG